MDQSGGCPQGQGHWSFVHLWCLPFLHSELTPGNFLIMPLCASGSRFFWGFEQRSASDGPCKLADFVILNLTRIR